MAADPVRVTIRVAEILDRVGISYVVGGSIASTLVGEPRATEDVDIAADLREEQVPALVAALQGEFNIIHLESVQKVDIFVLGSDLLDRRQIERRRLAVVARDPDRSVYLTSPEDIVLRKLDWYRAGGG